jgi:hypothetical protein
MAGRAVGLRSKEGMHIDGSRNGISERVDG